jgi:hypothetical protein
MQVGIAAREEPGGSNYNQGKPCICPKQPQPPAGAGQPGQPEEPGEQPQEPQNQPPPDSHNICPLCNGTTPTPKPPYYYYPGRGGYLPTEPETGT